MKIANKKSFSRKKKILIIIVAILLVGGGAGAFYYFNTQRSSNIAAGQARPVNTVDYNAPSKEEEQATSTQKDQIISDYNKGQDSGDGSDQPTSSDIVVSISRANQTSAGLSIGTVIDGAKVGTCSVSLAKSGQATIQKSFSISYEATSAMCQEAIIPIDQIPASGEWQLTVTATDGSKTSKPATQTVNIDKP